MRPLWALGFALLAASLACVGSEDNPSNVRDLRVLGIQLSPPELMAENCNLNPNALDASALVYFSSTPVTFKALMVDPKGEGRALNYELVACADPEDLTCSRPQERAVLAGGTLEAGAPAREKEWVLDLGRVQLADGTLLLSKVLELDDYKGLGGLRMPLVLHVSAGDEAVAAQKRMLFSCKLFEDQRANVQPMLPGLRLQGEVWNEEPVPSVQGPRPVQVTPLDFALLQEAYYAPSFSLDPVELEERWELSWYTTLGTFSPTSTGGVSFDGEEARQKALWEPPADAEAQQVFFWVVVRDGRGGLSWVQRSVRYQP